MRLNPLENRPCELAAKDLFRPVGSKNCCYLQPVRQDLLPKESHAALEGYGYLIRGIALEIKWEVMMVFGDYQGFCVYVGEDTEHTIYFLATGYGSCGGCDAFFDAVGDPLPQAPFQKVQELQEDMKRRLRSFMSLEEFAAWLSSEQRYGTEYWASFGSPPVGCRIMEAVMAAYQRPIRNSQEE